MKKILAVLLCILLLCATLAACASPAPAEEAPADDTTQAEEQPAAEEPTEEPADEPAEEPAEEPAGEDEQPADESAAGGLQAIKDAGKLVMLTNATFPPYEYLGEGGAVAGADVDIAQMIADEIGVELEVVDMDFDGLIFALQGGKGDLIAAGMTVTPERAEEVEFSTPYTDATQLIIVNKDDPKVTGPDDFEGKTIGVQLGTTGDIFIQWEIDDGANIELSQYKSNMDAAMDLINGRLDAIVLDELPAKNIAEANESLTIIEEPFTEEQYAMAVAKGNTELLEVMNSIMQQLIDAGEVVALTELHTQQYTQINEG